MLFLRAGHLFNAAAGLYAGVFVFDYAVLHTVGTGAAVYLLMLLTPRYANTKAAPPRRPGISS